MEKINQGAESALAKTDATSNELVPLGLFSENNLFAANKLSSVYLGAIDVIRKESINRSETGDDGYTRLIDIDDEGNAISINYAKRTFRLHTHSLRDESVSVKVLGQYIDVNGELALKVVHSYVISPDNEISIEAVKKEPPYRFAIEQFSGIKLPNSNSGVNITVVTPLNENGTRVSRTELESIRNRMAAEHYHLQGNKQEILGQISEKIALKYGKGSEYHLKAAAKKFLNDIQPVVIVPINRIDLNNPEIETDNSELKDTVDKVAKVRAEYLKSRDALLASLAESAKLGLAPNPGRDIEVFASINENISELEGFLVKCISEHLQSPQINEANELVDGICSLSDKDSSSNIFEGTVTTMLNTDDQLKNIFENDARIAGISEVLLYERIAQARERFPLISADTLTKAVILEIALCRASEISLEIPEDERPNRTLKSVYVMLPFNPRSNEIVSVVQNPDLVDIFPNLECFLEKTEPTNKNGNRLTATVNAVMKKVVGTENN